MYMTYMGMSGCVFFLLYIAESMFLKTTEVASKGYAP